MRIFQLIVFCLAIIHLDAQVKVDILPVGKSVTALYSETSGYLLYGTADGQVGRYDGLQLKPIGQVGSEVNVIQNEEDLIVGTKDGLYKWSGDRFVKMSPLLDVLSVLDNGSILFTRSGIYEKHGNNYRISDQKGLNAGAEYSRAKVLANDLVLLDDKLYKNDNWWKVKSKGVIDATLSEKGLIEVYLDSIMLNDKLLVLHRSGENARVQPDKGGIVLIEEEFIQRIEYDGSFRTIYNRGDDKLKCTITDAWNNDWLAIGENLYRISNESSLSEPIITEVYINKEDDYQVGDNNQDVTIKYDGVHLGDPQDLRFQSRLEGYDDWSEPTVERTKTYRSLPPGSYTYRLRATVDGSQYVYADAIKVRVADKSLTWIWMGLLALAIAIVLIAWIVNRRWETYKKKNQEERRKLLRENRLMALEQQALQLQMNPHFIFNALNSINGLIAKGESKLARKSITSFAQLMRSTLDQSRKEWTTVADEISYINQYLTTEKWVNQDLFDFEITIDEEVNKDMLIPSMLIQPVVENAIKHAFKNRSGDNLINVSLSKKYSSILVEVVDNGVGMETNKKNLSHNSVALNVIEERLSLLHRKAKIKRVTTTSPINEYDGTKVTLALPYK